MLLRCLKAEIQKFHRSPVWLVFLILPIFPAILGTGNYLGNLEALENGWYSLWSQHTLFSSMFFLPALLGVFCAWQWRLEHTDHNWNSFLTAPVLIRDLYGAKLILAVAASLLAQVCIGILFVLSGKIAGIPGSVPPELPWWLLYHPSICSASSHRLGRRYYRAVVHCARMGICVPILPSKLRDAS